MRTGKGRSFFLIRLRNKLDFCYPTPSSSGSNDFHWFAMPSSSPLRIVLFGPPAAAKTSLLGALSQAGQTQEQLREGKLVESAPRLARLRERLYEQQPTRTVEEVVSYDAILEPLADGAQADSWKAE